MGATILISRAVGANKLQKIPRLIGNSCTLFLMISVFSTIILSFFCDEIVRILKTPAEAIFDTTEYLWISFLGVPAIIAYNVIAAIFRGLGDSKSPLFFVAIACVCNVFLDFLLIGLFNLGAFGAALATVFAQLFSVIISLIFLLKIKWARRFTRKDFYPQKVVLKSLLGIGLPIACQDGFIQISFLFITAIANSRGLEIAAAVGIVEKIICFLFLVPSAILSTLSALCAQNFGAKKFDRVHLTLKNGLFIAASFGLFTAILFQFISPQILALFTSDSAVINWGSGYLRSYVVDCFLAGIHFAFSGYFCALGRSMLSFIHNFISIVCFRLPGVYLASIFFPASLVPMGCAAPMGSLFSAIFCIILYRHISKKLI